MVGLCEETVDDDSCPSSNSVVSPVVSPMALIIIPKEYISLAGVGGLPFNTSGAI
jgi:hypothetical protein